MDYDGAASLPTLATTVHEALINLSKLRKSDRVLIHAATGGIGLMAIQYAKKVGCDIVATAGAQFKQDYLRNNMKVEKISSSRDPEQFKLDTNGMTVNVVLNSLSDKFIDYSGKLIEVACWHCISQASAAHLAPTHRFPRCV